MAVQSVLPTGSLCSTGFPALPDWSLQVSNERIIDYQIKKGGLPDCLHFPTAQLPEGHSIGTTLFSARVLSVLILLGLRSCLDDPSAEEQRGVMVRGVMGGSSRPFLFLSLGALRSCQRGFVLIRMFLWPYLGSMNCVSMMLKTTCQA